MTRTQEREEAFILIFESMFQDGDIAELIAVAREILEWEQSDYVDLIVNAVCEKKDELDEMIAPFLKQGWSVKRLAKVPLALLRLAVYEIKYMDDIPASVSINEAVELCKTYSPDEKDASYINGILGSLVRAEEN